jgi:hypothetical protein
VQLMLKGKPSLKEAATLPSAPRSGSRYSSPASPARNKRIEMKLRFYKIGGSWVLLFRMSRSRLFHLGSSRWWKPITMLPVAILEQLSRPVS